MGVLIPHPSNDKRKTKITLGLLMRTSKPMIFGYKKQSHSGSVPFMAIPMPSGIREGKLSQSMLGASIGAPTTGGDRIESNPRPGSILLIVFLTTDG
jgi:hypothetical protein